MSRQDRTIALIGKHGRAKVKEEFYKDKRKNPKMWDAFRGLAIEKFVSILGDRCGLGGGWTEPEKGLYYKKFKGIPNDFLQDAFDDYILDELGKQPPTIPEIWQYVAESDGFNLSWSQYKPKSRRSKYCDHCRETEGKRRLFFRSDKTEKILEGFDCDCLRDSLSNWSGTLNQMTKNVQMMTKSDRMPNGAVMLVDCYDPDLGRIVMIEEQKQFKQESV